MNANSAPGGTGRGVGHLDLLLALGITAALNVAVFLPAVRATPVTLPLGLVFALLVPGYVLVAAVFPERYTETASGDAAGQAVATGTGVTVLERLLLAVGCSVLIVPTIGYLLNFTPVGVRLVPTLLATSGFTAITVPLAWLRRLRVPLATRFRAVEPVVGLAARDVLASRETSTTWSLLVVGAVVFFALSSGYALVGGATGESYSELYLLGEDGDGLTDGNVSVGDGPRTLEVGITNHEDRPVAYTVVVLRQQVGTDRNETAVRAQTELNRFEMRAMPGESVTRETTVPAAAGDSDRVTWLLYTGDAPEALSGETAAYQVYLWVDDPAGADRSAARQRERAVGPPEGDTE